MVRDKERFPEISGLYKGIRFSRKGRGFSIHELRNAGISISQARIIKIPIDFRRKTVYESNIGRLKMRAAPEAAIKADSSGSLEETG